MVEGDGDGPDLLAQWLEEVMDQNSGSDDDVQEQSEHSDYEDGEDASSNDGNAEEDASMDAIGAVGLDAGDAGESGHALVEGDDVSSDEEKEADCDGMPVVAHFLSALEPNQLDEIFAAAIRDIWQPRRLAVANAKELANVHSVASIERDGLSLVEQCNNMGEPTGTAIVLWESTGSKTGYVVRVDGMDRLVWVVKHFDLPTSFANTNVIVDRLPVTLKKKKGAERPTVPQWVVLLRGLAEASVYAGPIDSTGIPNAARRARTEPCVLCNAAGVKSSPIDAVYFKCYGCDLHWHLPCWQFTARRFETAATPEDGPALCPLCIRLVHGTSCRGQVAISKSHN